MFSRSSTERSPARAKVRISWLRPAGSASRARPMRMPDPLNAPVVGVGALEEDRGYLVPMRQAGGNMVIHIHMYSASARHAQDNMEKRITCTTP